MKVRPLQLPTTTVSPLSNILMSSESGATAWFLFLGTTVHGTGLRQTNGAALCLSFNSE